jgi:ubiquinone/menaquinone biosynthesis C-methylase UbiE
MSASNEKEIELWNGDVSARWVNYQAELDRRLRPFGEPALEGARLREGARVLDVGCGCGATTLTIAEKVGTGGSVVGLDVSAPMLARARERAAGQDHARFELADATTFTTTDPFDAIVSRFGVMFFADPIASFENLRRLFGLRARMPSIHPQQSATSMA